MAPALALAALAPASSHAQHMRSHIALRFGNWSQVVDSNKAAVAASDSYCAAAKAGNDCDADNRWHALEWQLYGQTQQCAIAAATTTYKRMQVGAGKETGSCANADAGAFLVFFIIMTAVYTDPKRYKAATPLSYLTGEDAILYKGLGQVYFVPTTRKQNALATFQLGLQLLHMFWYDLALEKFIEARTMDPKLGMAYWGEAMCHKQPLWQTEDVAGGQAALARMDAAVMVSTL
ncbi:hypothetical protein TSOC_001087, partial [Tetrabaena socialis]